MCKIVAKQVNPMHQDPFLYRIDKNNQWQWLNYFWTNISVLPQDRCYDVMTDVVESVYNTLESAYCLNGLGDNLDDFNIPDASPWYRSRTECINDFLPARKVNGKGYSTREISRLCKLVEEYGYKGDVSILCEVLHIVTGEEYDYSGIYGCSQGDYREIVYPASLYSQDDIKRFEVLYWNNGSEWQVVESDIDFDYAGTDDEDWPVLDDTDCVYQYVTAWSNDDIRKEIASYYTDCKPEDVVLLEYAGSHYTDYYRVA